MKNHLFLKMINSSSLKLLEILYFLQIIEILNKINIVFKNNVNIRFNKLDKIIKMFLKIIIKIIKNQNKK